MPVLRSPLLERAGFSHAFPTRDVGDGDLAAAVCHGLRQAGLGLRQAGGAKIVQVKQVHGAMAVRAEESALSALAGGALEADALVARQSAAVGVRVADCVPVLVARTDTGAVAAIHAGWRGVVAGVVPAGIELLGRGAILAAIGPCIGACCFEVGADVADRIGFVTRRAGEKAYVDLRAAVRAQLRALGLADDAIDDVPGCTKHEPDRFHSFRRDGANSGRMLAAIATRP